MSSPHIETRRKIRNIAEINVFEALLEQSTLTDGEKEMMRLHYLGGKDFRYIGDLFGYSESNVKKRHKKILSKLERLL